MKESFRLVGLDCANCAAKIENRIAKLEGVKSASVNFMTTKMVIDGDDSKMQRIVEEATKIINKEEPDVVIKKA